ncbi:hypothetical protein LTS07_011154 [Exophiala sideris]|uniref:Uncharacterized protein n=1 Tax=Exophiala sideris TaxID=1016849 RepID=A0ABR0J2S3_9EURO|nr:hypothetical protein LTS07_011154 [Exophiala sideris]KAK5023513.1 hypothetical protein LTR13_011198 [Exophiala sideris]KAK5054905.1 hypothetical protein LTR69_008813 [Exophiala sideris]KAK5176221.1 hypothetical protein LTR44_011233 [Eurotiomycetes sp. CCFEE 6388]
MLAVKFYNLQALIHRPILSPAKLLWSSPNPMAFYQAECDRIAMSKRKCIVAAQQTAKLLHDLEDKKSLVYGFPWWQMISCLICASSILLVASICVDLELDKELFKDIDWAAVDEDAEVCLKVFQALSSNSNAARLAGDMMQRLKKTRTISQGNSSRLSMSTSCIYSTTAWCVPFVVEPRSVALKALDLPLLTFCRASQGPAETVNQSALPSQPLPMPTFDYDGPDQQSFNHMFQTMPYEVSEPVLWSAQFVNAAYNPFLNPPDP